MQQLLSSLGPVTAVIGAQWGDEGKGKVVDILAEEYDVIARACGGANAGHTIVVDGKQTIFHLVPSGALHDGKLIVLGAGMVIHLPTLLEEIQVLRDAGIDIVPRLKISSTAHVLFDYHKEIDGVLEERRTNVKGQGIGTTKRGIGPAYMDKAERTGFRMDILQADAADLQQQLEERSAEINVRYGVTIDGDTELSHITEAASILSSCIDHQVPRLLHDELAAGRSMLIEGAQATLLDIDHGTYPYVTSSATTIAGALQGLGQPPGVLHSCVGVAKAYCTRVGSGDFLTEADENDANRLRERGGEYGATTGRPRRCGWLDIADLKYAAMINGYSHWNITKLDVLDEEDRIPVGMGVDASGNQTYEYLDGWKTSTAGMTSHDDLPENAKAYIQFIEDQTGVPVSLIGTGPDRDEMIVRA